MRKKKSNVLSLLLAVFILAFGAVSPALGAGETAGLVISSPTVSPGGQGVVVAVNVTDHPNIRGIDVKIKYDPAAMSFVSGTLSGDWTWVLTPSVTDDGNGTVTIFAVGAAGTIPAAADTKLAQISFNMSDTLPNDSYAVAYDTTSNGLIDDGGGSEDVITLTVTDGSLSVARDPKVTATVTTDAATGSITPAGETTYAAGDTPTYTVTPATGYRVLAFTVTGDDTAALGGDNSYTLAALADGDNITINVGFELIPTWVVTASAGDGGTIEPLGESTYNDGDTPTYTVTPDTHYELDTLTVLGDDAAVLDDNMQYTFAALTGAATINATFKLMSYTVTSTAGEGGAIDPAGENMYAAGSTPSFTVTPIEGYVVDTFTVSTDDAAALTDNGDGTFSYGIAELTGDTTIDVTFKPGTHDVTVSAGAGGSVTTDPEPVEGVVTVQDGESVVITVTPDATKEVDMFLVGGVDMAAELMDYSYTLTPTADVAVVVSFKEAVMYNVTATATPASGGILDPAGAFQAKEGAELVFTVTPMTELGWEVESAVVNGAAVEIVDDMFAVTVDEDLTVDVVFAGGRRVSSADTDLNNKISLSELLRGMQLFNNGAYHCDPDGEELDGYASGKDTTAQSCEKHTSDYLEPYWVITLSEFLRLSQFYNLNGYYEAPEGTETIDGFVPGVQP